MDNIYQTTAAVGQSILTTGRPTQRPCDVIHDLTGVAARLAGQLSTLSQKHHLPSCPWCILRRSRRSRLWRVCDCWSRAWTYGLSRGRSVKLSLGDCMVHFTTCQNISQTVKVMVNRALVFLMRPESGVILPSAEQITGAVNLCCNLEITDSIWWAWSRFHFTTKSLQCWPKYGKCCNQMRFSANTQYSKMRLKPPVTLNCYKFEFSRNFAWACRLGTQRLNEWR